MSTTGQGQHGQERQAIEKLAHSHQGQEWTPFLRELNQEANKGQQGIPTYYSAVAENVEEGYNRLPQNIKDSLKQMPPQTVASLFEVCGWVARTSEQQGEQQAQSIAHFIASSVEQSTRALSGMTGRKGGAGRS